MIIDVYSENKTIYGNQYYEVITVFILLLFVIFKLYLHRDQNQANQEQVQVQVQSQVSQAKSADISPVQAEKISPKPNLVKQLKPVDGVLTHTAAIGTADNPTIDGGFINAADGLPVTVPIPISNTNVTNAPQHSAEENATENSRQKDHAKIGGIFRDEWATSSRIRDFLKSAAKDGKLAYVLEQTEEKGLPASVAVVPMIESNYQANVTSNKGAAGVWQLMSTTAKDYGLNNGDRYKFEPSTQVALNLLQNLHKQFGSWELAFAAYNAGAERVGNALQRNPGAQSVQDLDLPKETKDYVMHVMTINKIIGSL